MSRFATTFARLRAEASCGLFPWLMAGYPDVATSQTLALAALEAGVDGFEIGVPFSDPLADGPTMQRANAAALAGGATVDTALDLARFIRTAASDVPIALMSYANPVMQRGETTFATTLAAAKVDALIVADLPTGEADTLQDVLRTNQVDLIPLVAPTSPDARIRRIVEDAEGFVYCVSLIGVTGVRAKLSTSLANFLGRVQAATTLPLVIGFGVSRSEHVRLAKMSGADGVIIASALADLVERSPDPVEAVHRYLTELQVGAW